MIDDTEKLMDTGEASREACRRLKEAIFKIDEEAKARAALEAQVKRVADAIDRQDEKRSKIGAALKRIWRAVVAAVGDLEK